MHLDLSPHHGRRSATQDVHSERRLDVAEEELDIPATKVELGQIVGAVGRRIKQRGHQVEGFGPVSRVVDRDLDLAQRQVIRKGFPFLATVAQRRLPRRFGPLNEQIIRPQDSLGL